MNKIKFTAPEIFEKNNFTEKTDIWFLGVTFFQLMTFNFPFKVIMMMKKWKVF